MRDHHLEAHTTRVVETWSDHRNAPARLVSTLVTGVKDRRRQQPGAHGADPGHPQGPRRGDHTSVSARSRLRIKGVREGRRVAVERLGPAKDRQSPSTQRGSASEPGRIVAGCGLMENSSGRLRGCRTYSPFIRSQDSKPGHASDQCGRGVGGVSAGQILISQTSARSFRAEH